MNNIFRGLLAGWGAAKLGGGCFGTILVFALIWVVLGQCDGNQRAFRRGDVKSNTVTMCASPSNNFQKKEVLVFASR